MGNVRDLDIHRGWVKQIKPPTRQHPLPRARLFHLFAHPSRKKPSIQPFLNRSPTVPLSKRLSRAISPSKFRFKE
jgi:hypothetical protein